MEPKLEPNTEPKKEPWEINSMDDLRAAMNRPEIKAANKEFSKKYLKANRPKSIAVVVVALVALFAIISFSSHKASNVTPVTLRTAEQVDYSLEGADTASAALTAQQRDALLDLLGQVKVKRQGGAYTGAMPLPVCTFTAGADTFTLTSSGLLVTSDNTYEILSPGAEDVWARLTDVLTS